MAPRNKSLPPNSQVEDSAAGEADTPSAHEQEITDPELVTTRHEADAVWAAASRMEGYTPLTDTRTNGAVFMAFNPHADEENDNDGTTFSGAFFADMSAFGPSSMESDDEQSQREEQESEEQEASLEDKDFRSAADQALQALDEEYSMTQGSVSVPSVTVHERSPDELNKKPEPAVNVLAPASSLPSPTSYGNGSIINIPSIQTTMKQESSIDTDAVRKAVNAIRLKAPRLTSDLNKWEEEHGVSNTSAMALAPREHAIIPKTPLAAFWRQSAKAMNATANLSRSATLAEAIVRLSCIGDSSTRLQQEDRLVIHVVGADEKECSSDEQLRHTFGPLVRWIGALQNSPKHIDVRLIGPNVPTKAARRPHPLDLMPSNKVSRRPLLSATATCHQSIYHEWIQSQERESSDDSFRPPDVAIAFNSGIYGYNEWLSTLEALCSSSRPIPFVSTAYTMEECEDDAEVIENVVSTSGAPCLWRAEANPFASRSVRETATAPAHRGCEYRENAAWQAWRLGGVAKTNTLD